MPFELGLDFGCRSHGGGRLSSKVTLVLEEERYRYQAAISDLAGSDVEAHHGDYQVAVRNVRTWFAGMPGFEPVGTALAVGKFLEAEGCGKCGKGYSSSSPANA